MEAAVKPCISNIAWDSAEEPAIARLLADLGVQHVEVAPTKTWPQPLSASDAELDAYRRFWSDHGIQISAMQALLYGREDLVLFQGPAQRRALLQYLRGIFHVGARLGAGPLVFGSPKNRRRGGLPTLDADAIAVEFFAAAGRAAYEAGTVLCIESNPPDYGCDWITTTEEAERLVRAVATPGFALHLDAGGMLLAQEDGAAAIRRYGPSARHFHISEPFLGAVGEGGVDHVALAGELRGIEYDHLVSIEMRHDATRDARTEVTRVLTFLLEVYGAARGNG